MAPKKRKRRDEIDFRVLKLDDVMCPICREIIIEPVSLPCKHNLCYFCFDKTIENNTLTCPICRKRIGSWLRLANKNRSVINLELWSEIQKQFPEQVKLKTGGEDDGVEEEVIGQIVNHISSPGKIRKEYEEECKRFLKEQELEQRKIEKASSELIQQLLEEETKEKTKRIVMLRQITEKDEEIAKSLALDDNMTVAENAGKHIKTAPNLVKKDIKIKEGQQKNVTLDKYFSPKVVFDNLIITPRSPSHSSCSSRNSIDVEFSHFKPIIKEPKTPPKKFPDGSVLDSSPRRIRPLNLDLSGSFDAGSSQVGGLLPRLQGPSMLTLSAEEDDNRCTKAFSRIQPLSGAESTSGCSNKVSLSRGSSTSVRGPEICPGNDSDTDFEEEVIKSTGEPTDPLTDISVDLNFSANSTFISNAPLRNIAADDDDPIVPLRAVDASFQMAGPSSTSDIITVPFDENQQLYSVLEQEFLVRLQQEQEDRKLAMKLQAIWDEQEHQVSNKVTSDYKLRRRRRRPGPSGVRTASASTSTSTHQTTLDKHIQPVSL